MSNVNPYERLLYGGRIAGVPFIQKKVCEIAEVSYDDFMLPGKTRGAGKREVANARQISMKIIRDRSQDVNLRRLGFPSMSLSDIGAMHGGRDHATVLHACHQVSTWLDIRDPFTVTVYTKTMKLLTKYEEDMNNPSQENTIFNTEK